MGFVSGHRLSDDASASGAGVNAVAPPLRLKARPNYAYIGIAKAMP
jgi:hypothetical protein